MSWPSCEELCWPWNWCLLGLPAGEACGGGAVFGEWRRCIFGCLWTLKWLTWKLVRVETLAVCGCYPMLTAHSLHPPYCHCRPTLLPALLIAAALTDSMPHSYTLVWASCTAAFITFTFTLRLLLGATLSTLLHYPTNNSYSNNITWKCATERGRICYPLSHFRVCYNNCVHFINSALKLQCWVSVMFVATCCCVCTVFMQCVWMDVCMCVCLCVYVYTGTCVCVCVHVVGFCANDNVWWARRGENRSCENVIWLASEDITSFQWCHSMCVMPCDIQTTWSFSELEILPAVQHEAVLQLV